MSPANVNIEKRMESLDSCFQVIASFIDALQKNFKEDTMYAYPLLPSQTNTMFALDEEVAVKMKSYICALMREACGFNDEEFHILQRPCADEGGLYKLRLEFKRGMDFELIRELSEKTQRLEERLIQTKAAR